MQKELSVFEMEQAEMIYLEGNKSTDYNELSKDQRYYIALKYGFYDLIRFEEFDFNNLKQIVEKYPVEASKMAEHCQTKEQQKELFKIALNKHFKYITHFYKSYPQLAYEYVVEELDVVKRKDNRINYQNKETKEFVTIMLDDLKNILTLADKVKNKEEKNKKLYITKDMQRELN